MMTQRYVSRSLYKRARAKAQLMRKVSLGLLIAIAVLLVGVSFQTIEKRQLQKQYSQLTKELSATSSVEQPAVQDPVSQASSIQSTSQASIVNATCLGEYTITYYCPCEECSEGWGNKTSTGAYAQEGITVAVDPNKIPYGTLLYIDGIGYRIAQDCGGAIKGNKIDVYLNSHKETVERGIHKAETYIITTGGTKDEQK